MSLVTRVPKPFTIKPRHQQEPHSTPARYEAVFRLSLVRPPRSLFQSVVHVRTRKMPGRCNDAGNHHASSRVNQKARKSSCRCFRPATCSTIKGVESMATPIGATTTLPSRRSSTSSTSNRRPTCQRPAGQDGRAAIRVPSARAEFIEMSAQASKRTRTAQHCLEMCSRT